MKQISYKILSRTISKLLADGYPTIDQTAERLSISVRSLQRRLHDLGYNYSEIVEDVRCSQACQLLRNSEVSVSRTAVLLGYRDPSSFSRAFVRWMQMPPRTYRRRYLE